MELRAMPFFEDFSNAILTGKEYEVYLHQGMSLAKEKAHAGHFQRLIRVGPRIIVINYYMSLKLDALFAMTGHLQRTGEPRDKEKKALAVYLRQFKELEREAEHENG